MILPVFFLNEFIDSNILDYGVLASQRSTIIEVEIFNNPKKIKILIINEKEIFGGLILFIYYVYVESILINMEENH